MSKVIAYVDGFNLYYGLRSKRWKWFYWLNIQEMAHRMLKPGQTLVGTKYFTSVVKHPSAKHKRQATYLEALRTLSDLQIYFGHFLSDTVTCRRCGNSYQTYHEKMTDVNIATELMSDAFRDGFDTALLISADSDLVGPIKSVLRLFSKKRVVVAFPPDRYSNQLKRVATAYTHIGRNVLSKSVFPNRVAKPDGFVLQRPASWQ
jgi:uncharacterized LabA/DUF88 family protein